MSTPRVFWAVFLLGACDRGLAPRPEPVAKPAAATAAPASPAASNPEPEPSRPEAAAVAVSEPAPPQRATPKKATQPAAKQLASAPSPAADSKPTGSVRGQVKSQAHYDVWLEGAARYPAKKPATLSAVLVAKSPFKCNDKYPYKLVLDAAPEGVSFPSSTVRSMNVTKSRGTMSVPFVPATPGTKKISGTLSFSVCTDEKCLIEKQSLAVSVVVGEP